MDRSDSSVDVREHTPQHATTGNPARSGGLQVDLYGVKVAVTPSPDTSAEPATWPGVAQVLNQQLMAIVSNTITLAADVVRAARSIVRGVGAIPAALARRVGDAHAQADAAEQSRASGRLREAETAHDVQERLSAFLDEKRRAGLEVHAFLDPDTNHVVVCLLPPTGATQLEDLVAAAVLTAVKYDDQIKELNAELSAVDESRSSLVRSQLTDELLTKLPARDAAVLKAVFLDQRDHDDVCGEFGVDRNYLRVLIHRALERFRPLI